MMNDDSKRSFVACDIKNNNKLSTVNQTVSNELSIDFFIVGYAVSGLSQYACTLPLVSIKWHSCQLYQVVLY